MGLREEIVSAIGVISTGGPDPRLLRDLPMWLAHGRTGIGAEHGGRPRGRPFLFSR
jgi:hypothetical protein